MQRNVLPCCSLMQISVMQCPQQCLVKPVKAGQVSLIQEVEGGEDESEEQGDEEEEEEEKRVQVLVVQELENPEEEKQRDEWVQVLVQDAEYREEEPEPEEGQQREERVSNPGEI